MIIFLLYVLYQKHQILFIMKIEKGKRHSSPYNNIITYMCNWTFLSYSNLQNPNLDIHIKE